MMIHSMGGGGVLQHIFGRGVHHAIKNWTETDLRFCENEGSKRSKINWKRGQLHQKSKQNSYKLLIIHFGKQN